MVITSHRAAVAALSFAGLLLGACGGGGGGPSTGPTATPAPTAAPTETATSEPTTTPSAVPSASPTATPSDTATVSIYLVRNGRLQPVHRQVSLATPARDSLLALVAGPTATETAMGMTDAVPATTKVLGLTIATSGIATVDVTQDFTSGSADSQSLRAAQVVDTLTEFHSVRSVVFDVEGAPVLTLGAVTTSRPVTRTDVELWNPAILVEAPVAGATVSSPLRIWGTANTFEAVFRIRMTTQSGTQLFDYQVQATSGTATRGSFDVTVRFTATGAATLEAYEVSMKDGSHVNVVDVPLTLQPPS